MEEEFCFEPPSMREEPYSVTELNKGISTVLTQAGNLVMVEGELSGCKRAGSGHYYLQLADDSSQVPAVIWRGNTKNCEVLPQMGMKVTVVALIRVYERGGYYQLDIQNLWETGKGRKAAELEALKQKLFDEGLFDSDRKQELPSEVRKVAVVTAEGSAAFSDIYKTLKKCDKSVDILFVPTVVQGDTAPPCLVKSLILADKTDADVIIFGRGGGSKDDLSCFDDERVVRAVAATKKPLISGIGHEIDTSLSDLAADFRAATPTAAAELATSGVQGLKHREMDLVNRFAAISKVRLASKFSALGGYSRNYGMQNLIRRIKDASITVDNYEERIADVMRVRFAQKAQRLQHLVERLNGLNPLSIMGRGYSIVKNSSGKQISSKNDVKSGDLLELQFYDGSVHARVEAEKETTSIEDGLPFFNQ